ncbi:MAG TPA: hypothetical protein VMT24_14940, partial [Aggregatilineaceae bacterium]|nr:hypothetical protein [Aggregatilineaceae bacterium]
MIARLTRFRQAAVLCAAAAVLTMVASAYSFRAGPLVELNQPPDPSSTHFAQQQPRYDARASGLQAAALWMLLGGILLGGALRLARRSPDLPAVTGQPLSRVRTRWLAVGLGASALGALAATNGDRIGPDWLSRVPAHVQFGLLGGGMALLVWGLGGSPVRFHPTDLSSPPDKGNSRRWLKEFLPHLKRRLRETRDRREVLLVAGITLLALILRTWKLNDTVHTFVDELNFASAVREFWLAGDVKLLHPITGVIAFPRLYPYWQSLTVWLL